MKKFMKFTGILGLVLGMFSPLVGFAANEMEAYKFSASIKVPVTKKGVRNYENQTFKGTIYFQWPDESSAENVVGHAYLQNRKTGKIIDTEVTSMDSDFDPYVFQRMGKDFKVPAINFAIKDDTFLFCAVGRGSVRRDRTKNASCCCGDVCSEKCYRATSFSGYIVGFHDCHCGGNSPTFGSTKCGIDKEAQYSIAPVYGTWRMSLLK